MKIIYNSHKSLHPFSESMKQIVEKRFLSLEKFLKEDESVKVAIETFKNDRIKVKAQVVLKDNHRVRAEETGVDFYKIVTNVRDDIEEQIRRLKRDHKFTKQEDAPHIKETESEFKVSKEKVFVLDSISPEMARDEMEKLGHVFYIFRNKDDNDNVCVVYSREDGGYALITAK